MGNIRELEQKATLRILITLLDGEQTYTEVKTKVKAAQDTINRALNNLINLGLIVEKFENKFPRRRLFNLTVKGRKIALLLKKIEEELKY